jgi:hypothetical protein
VRSRAFRWVGIALTVAALVALGRGLLLRSYEPVTSDAYLWGAFHVHSTLSDGLGSIEDIAGEARAARVSFVMLSDHGAPHREAATLSRTIDGVRFIGGSEVGIPEGHLIVSDVDRVPLYALPPYPPEAVEEAREWGGFAVVTYPDDPVLAFRYWDDDFLPQGIEIVNVTSYFRAASVPKKLAWAFFSLFDSRYFVSGFERPEVALERWDALLERGEVFGYYANNAHGGFPLTEEATVSLPSYETALGFVGLGVDRSYEASPEEAVRRGEFFALVRAAGEPDRFEIVEEEGAVRVTLETAVESARIDLKLNGEVIESSRTGSIEHEVREPGVYRAEVYLEDHPLLADDVPWILSKPLLLGIGPRLVPPPGLECGSVDEVALEELRLEHDDESSGTIGIDDTGALKLDYELSGATPEKVDRWVALALRKELDLSPYRGIYFSGSAPSPMRYWIEIRSGADEHYASVKVVPGGGGGVVPWKRFYPTLGERREIPLATIDSLFVTVNTSNSQTGFAAELEIETLGFCRN